jgi:hypothetical protein
VVQIYLKEGQYSAEQIGGLRQKLNDYIADYNLQNVSVNIDTIKK